MNWREELRLFVEKTAPRDKAWQRRPRPDNTPEQIATLGEITKPKKEDQ